ncbi:hypothetical protein [Parasphingorhabdus halotolerans]|uniref:Lipoprotein n=1 Tax=Parasphingorhabdus halotolerans TaxID=2725558 RepID=A0A6H2DN68_9SPHN|nr:hypothetical protein [Parasphingorhabdus halotolerans]QJB69433.1 hypothetical protein HF685_09180 [Parasphingorhabdus halotolerans]
MRITVNNFSAIATVFSLAACSTAQPEPTPAPAPAPVVQTSTPAPAQVPVSDDWTEWPIAPGTWVYRQDDRGSIALFGPANADATLTVRCDRDQRQIFLSRAGQATSGAQTTLRASSGLQSYPTRSTGSSSPYYSALALAPADYMLDRIAFSRGRFAVQTTGMQPLAIPVWAEFARVVEDCR